MHNFNLRVLLVPFIRHTIPLCHLILIVYKLNKVKEMREIFFYFCPASIRSRNPKIIAIERMKERTGCNIEKTLLYYNCFR